jgi:hypothetical protein
MHTTTDNRCLAWETSTDDVRVVLMARVWKAIVENNIGIEPEHYSLEICDEHCKNIIAKLDVQLVQREALEGIDLDQQTKYAHAEIERQLVIITKESVDEWERENFTTTD